LLAVPPATGLPDSGPAPVANSGRRRDDRSAWVALACLLGFVLLALVINEQGAVGFDAPVSAWVKGLPVPADVWLALTAAGGVILVPIGIGIVLALALLHRLRSALIYGIALLAASVWTYLVKVTIARQRPPGEPLVEATGFSFPSGHTLNSTVTYGLIALLIWRSAWPLWLRRASAIALGALVILVGLSRIALGVHYPSDVVGGWLAGLAVVAMVAWFT
jgi:undecaprenyl-diphosphatase